MNEEAYARLKKSGQFHEAFRRALRTGRNVPDGPILNNRDQIAKMAVRIVHDAIAAQRGAEVKKITDDAEYENFVDADTQGAAVTFLNETTVIDLSPDEL